MRYSIITINFNNKDGLSHTINSIISQTNNDYEFLIIDGGSDDGSKEIIIKYDKQITYWVSEKESYKRKEYQCKWIIQVFNNIG